MCRRRPVERHLRDEDLLVRLGGDELAVLLPDADAGGAKNAPTAVRYFTVVGTRCSWKVCGYRSRAASGSRPARAPRQ